MAGLLSGHEKALLKTFYHFVHVAANKFYGAGLQVDTLVDFQHKGMIAEVALWRFGIAVWLVDTHRESVVQKMIHSHVDGLLCWF